MRIKKCLLLSPILGLLFFSSCRKNDFDVLPKETDEGLNTFGCIIEGEILVPKDGETGIGGQGADGLYVTYRKDSLVNSFKPPYFAIQASNYLKKIK